MAAGDDKEIYFIRKDLSVGKITASMVATFLIIKPRCFKRRYRHSCRPLNALEFALVEDVSNNAGTGLFAGQMEDKCPFNDRRHQLRFHGQERHAYNQKIRFYNE